jgi:hypothetical protein
MSDEVKELQRQSYTQVALLRHCAAAPTNNSTIALYDALTPLLFKNLGYCCYNPHTKGSYI